jgi:hypothetical protein
MHIKGINLVPRKKLEALFGSPIKGGLEPNGQFATQAAR